MRFSTAAFFDSLALAKRAAIRVPNTGWRITSFINTRLNY